MNDETNIYQDAPNYHHEDERALNVVERIKEVSNRPYARVEDDSTEENELKRAITNITTGLGSTSSSIATMRSNIGVVPTGHTVCGDIASINQTISNLSQTITSLANRPKILKAADVELDSSTQIATAELYEALKSSMTKGDILVDEFNLSDGPSGLGANALEHVGILAYCTADNVTDGDGTYSRAYLLASSKSTSDMWNCQLIRGTYTWVQINA